MYCRKSEIHVSRRRCEQAVLPRPSFAETYRTFRTNVGLSKLALDPEEIFGDMRDETPERAVDTTNPLA